MLSLKLITEDIKPSEIELLVKWRKAVQPLWHENFKVTYAGTKKWIKDKTLFFVIKDNKMIGHIGFDDINLERCYIGNVIRGEGKSDGSMTLAMKMIIKIAILINPNIWIKVSPWLKEPIKFYKKIGFKPYLVSNSYLEMKYER